MVMTVIDARGTYKRSSNANGGQRAIRRIGHADFGRPKGWAAVSHVYGRRERKAAKRSSRTIRCKTSEWHFAVFPRLRTPALRPRH
jgi:hypothetical protein